MRQRLTLAATTWVLLNYPVLGGTFDSSCSSSSGLPDDQQQGECRIVSEPDKYENAPDGHERRFPRRSNNQHGYSSTPHIDLKYDLYHCPRQPPMGYPVHWNASDVLQNWPIHQTNVPARIHQGLCVLNYTTMDDQNIAMTYLNAEVPFVLRNLADIDATSRKWQQAGYLEQLLGRKRNKYGQVINSTTNLDDDDTVPLFLVHKSPNYKFMYWKLEDGETYTDENAWSPPTEKLRMSFADYRKLTQKKQSSSNVKRDGDDDDDEKDQPHYYLYADGFWKRNDNDNDNDDSNDAKRIDSQLHRWHLFHELPRFQLFDESLSSSSSSMQYRPPDVFQELVNGEAFQKMLCKIGTRGNHADMHFDQGRNTIVLLTGRRRYLLAHPSTCPQWHLYNIPHPSYRHSMLDFENASSWDTSSSGGSSRIMMNEVILEPGDVLILPSYWFHSVVLLEDDSAQCNGWSTPTRTYRNVIESCGSFLRQQ